MDQSLQLLGGQAPGDFLAKFWQKKPLLIKQAIPEFKSFITPSELAGLACEEAVQSRIIRQQSRQQNKQWHVQHGPFNEADFAKLGGKDWTLLVQNVNHYLPEARELLQQFNFIPHARLDDLMVSYAPEGGGIGAHVDSYDVFLLQAEGKREWKISTQTDASLIEDAPIKVLKNFTPEQSFILEAGDMLYLPPHIAHQGFALDDNCMTYSIGFRAPKTQELMHEFLSYLQDELHDKQQNEGLYSDADLTVQSNPAEISQMMLDKVDDMLKQISWDKSNVADFLGRYMTEPKPEVFFQPKASISIEKFSSKLAKQSLQLNLKSQLLFIKSCFYINGEAMQVPENLMQVMQDFANHRRINTTILSSDLQQALAECLHSNYIAGYIEFAE